MQYKCPHCDFQGSCDDYLYYHIGDKHRNIEIRNTNVFLGIFHYLGNFTARRLGIPQSFMMWVIAWTKSFLRHI